MSGGNLDQAKLRWIVGALRPIGRWKMSSYIAGVTIPVLVF